MDSLHIASAKLLQVDEFITNEKQINPFIVAKALTLSPFMIYNIVHALLILNKNNRRFYI